MTLIKQIKTDLDYSGSMLYFYFFLSALVCLISVINVPLFSLFIFQDKTISNNQYIK